MLRYLRIIIFLWAAVLIMLQSDVITDLRHDRDFWWEVAFSTAESAAKALNSNPCAKEPMWTEQKH